MSGPARLVLEDVGADLGGKPVLQGVSTALQAGSFAALVGPNGAGKTSLLRAVAGLISHRGRVLLDGAAVAGMTATERARAIAYLPQANAVHWPLPARDIVALGRFPHGADDPAALPAADTAIVTAAMQAADVLDLADRPVTELSGGERARVALARVLAVEARLILADEPIAALDPRHQFEIMQLLRATAEGGALVLAVTHDLGLAARFCDRILVLDRGRLVAADTAERALTSDVLAEVFGIEGFRTTHRGVPVFIPWQKTP